MFQQPDTIALEDDESYAEKEDLQWAKRPHSIATAMP